MPSSNAASVAIIGGGPGGSATAAFLAGRGFRVGLFHTKQPRSLVVGESLVPAVVPILRRLGVEDAVAAVSLRKPGATINFDDSRPHSLPFADAGGGLPEYSYNTPRDAFDTILREAAEAAGARLFPTTARVTLVGPRRIALDEATLDATSDYFAPSGPDFIVDASGRARLLARRLGLPSLAGGRSDVALFAHYEDAALDDPGNIHVDRLRRGWGWRIPLPGRVSVGVVVHPQHLPEGSREEKLDGFIADDPWFRERVKGERLTPVARYDNYQLHSATMSGPGWALVGDAAGFADPIFSTGTYLALRGAELLADALGSGSRAALDAYATAWRRELLAWQRIVGMWYDGSLFSLLRTGRFMRRLPPARPIDRHVATHLTRIFTGEAGRAGYGTMLLEALWPLGLAGAGPLGVR